MAKLLILHPYRETYTDIYSCLSKNHHYTLLIDDSKVDSFETNKPTNVTLVTTQHYPEKRKEIYKQIQEIVRKDLPMYMIVHPLNNVVTKKDIKNFKLDPANSHRLYGISIGE